MATTQKNNRVLFRAHALQHYMDKSKNDLLPRIISPPVFVLMWMLFGVVLISGLIGWMERVPVFTESSGLVRSDEQQVSSLKHNVDVVVFIPTANSTQMHIGMAAKAKFDTSTQYFDGTIVTKDALVLSPVAIRKQYQLTCSMMPDGLVASIAVTILVPVPANIAIENGALSQVQIQTGSQSVLDLLPLFHQISGDA